MRADLRERLGRVAVVLDSMQALLQREPSVPAVRPWQRDPDLGFYTVDTVEELAEENVLLVTGHPAARVSDANQKDASEAALDGTGEDLGAAWWSYPR